MHSNFAGVTIVVLVALGAVVGGRVQNGPAPVAEAPLGHSSPPLDPAAAKALKNPVPLSPEAVTRGRRAYLQFCAECHGEGGRVHEHAYGYQNPATDLMQPAGYNSGASEGEIFRSIRDGAGLTMPPFRGRIKTAAEIWDLVHFIQSLWPDTVPRR